MKKMSLNRILLMGVTLLVISISMTALSNLAHTKNTSELNTNNTTPVAEIAETTKYITEQNNNPPAYHKISPPKENIIILRMDDVQARSWSKIVMNLTDDVLSKNMSITLGVIPDRDMNGDIALKNYLLGKVKDPRIEIAQHGWNHSTNEFLNLSEIDAYNKLKLGYDAIVNTFGVYPTTFIPPYNVYNNDTVKALSKLNFSLISAKYNQYDFNDSVVSVGYNVATKDKDLTPITDIINSCNSSLAKRNLCVIMIHPQDYANKDEYINETEHAKFIELLDELNRLNVRFTTFNKI